VVLSCQVTVLRGLPCLLQSSSSPLRRSSSGCRVRIVCCRNPPGGCRRYAVWDEIYEQHLPCRIVCLLVCPAFVCTFDISVHPPKGQRHGSGKRSLGSSYCRRRCCQRYRSRDRLSGDWSRAMAVGRGSCLCGIRTCALRPRSALLRAVRRRMR
jgi:hypothetical protein